MPTIPYPLAVQTTYQDLLDRHLRCPKPEITGSIPRIAKLKAPRSVHVMFGNGDAAEFTLTGSSGAISSYTTAFAR